LLQIPIGANNTEQVERQVKESFGVGMVFGVVRIGSSAG
jgi:hypothetical protein